jgi:hypothetical protein
MTTSTTTAGTTMRAIIHENYGEAENVRELGLLPERTNPKGNGISLGAPDRRHPRG